MQRKIITTMVVFVLCFFASFWLMMIFYAGITLAIFGGVIVATFAVLQFPLIWFATRKIRADGQQLRKDN
ncbi:MAG TPA: hypothetical protein VMJ32_10180 [Pirellulales bacterium]|nr:hypothetical protein [Pirellulales bacterium]